MNHKGVIFDFFGVISSEIAPFWFAKYFPQDQIINLKEKYVSPADRGEISYTQLIDELAKAANIAPEKVKKEWDDLVIINEKVVAFIKETKGTHKVGLLSDSPSEFLRSILHKHNLENLFDTIVISSEVNITKKNKDIYSLILKKMGLDPTEVIFIDDNINNIKIAEELGIRGYKYDSTIDISLDRLAELWRATLIASAGASTRLAGSRLADEDVEQISKSSVQK